MKRLNVQTHPELNRLELGRVQLEYTRHAREQASDKCVPTPMAREFGPGAIVELERVGECTTKLVIRVANTTHTDSVYVLVPLTRTKFKVVTCWSNNRDDMHATLDLTRISD